MTNKFYSLPKTVMDALLASEDVIDVTEPVDYVFPVGVEQSFFCTDPNQTYTQSASSVITFAGVGDAPSLPPLFNNTRLEDSVPNWEGITLPDNYTSPISGEVISVAVTFYGDAVDETTLLFAGDTAGYRLDVTGNQGSSATYDFPAITVSATVPSQVRNLIATSGNNSVSLQYDLPLSTGGAPIQFFRIERNVAGAGWEILEAALVATFSNQSYTDETAINGISYQYRVSAGNSVGIGPPSSVASATPSGDVTAPVLTGSWDNNTETFTFNLSEPATIYGAIYDSTNTVAPDGNGGFTGTTIETFSQSVTQSGITTVTVTGTSGDRVVIYARDAAGNDSGTIVGVATFAPAPTGQMIDHGHFTQTTNLTTVGASETTPAAFSKAGTFIVGITDVTAAGRKDYTLSGSNVSGTPSLLVERTFGSSDTDAHFYEVTTTGPSDLVVTSQNGNDSFKRGVHIVELDGLTTTGFLSDQSALFDQTDDAGAIASIANVTAGQWVFAIAISRATGSTSADWGGSFTGTAEIDDRQLDGTAHRSTAAIQAVTTNGTFNAAPTFNGSDGSGFTSTLAIALDNV